MNSWVDEDDVLQELGAYLNNEETEREPKMPSTIQKYHKIIASNNEGSIFDDNYDLENASCNSANSVKNSKKNVPVGLFTDENVIRVQSGRGRGIKTVFKPAQTPKVGIDSTEEQIYHQLRKVNPTGYSNEVTENSVRRIQEARSPSNFSSPSKGKLPPSLISSLSSARSSKSSSPATMCGRSSSTSSNFGSRNNISKLDNDDDNKSVTSATESISSIPVFNYENDNASVPSGSSSSSKESRSIPIFDNDNSLMSSSSTSLNPCAAPFVCKSEQENDGDKPKPLSELLRASREHRKRYLESQQQELLSSYNIRQENELASKKTIEKILQQDKEELEQELSDTASQSSNLSWRRRANSPTSNLSWRRRTNSPPRQSYTNKFKNGDHHFVNINSTLDFPPLK